MLPLLGLLSPLLGLFNPATLAGMLPSLAGFIPAIGASLKTYWKLYLVGLVIALLSGSSFMWHHDAGLLKTEKAAHAADIKSYKDAQVTAQAKVDADRVLLLKQSKDKANAADKNYGNLLATYRANLLRFQASQGIGKGPGSAPDGNATPGVDGPGASSLIPQGATIAITTDDAGICATNTARLSAAHDWALQLGKKTDATTKPN